MTLDEDNSTTPALRSVDVDRLRRIEAVTFDASGTLFRARRLGEVYAEVLGRHAGRGVAESLDPEVVASVARIVWGELSCSADPRRDRFTAHAGGELGFWRHFIERLGEHLGIPRPSRFAMKELHHRFAKASAWEMFADVGPALTTLRALGLRLAVVANWDSRLSPLLADLGLADHFVVVVTSSAVGVEKPHPRIFEAVIAALDLPPDRVLHVGDQPLTDVEGAQAADLSGFLLDRRAGQGLGPLVAGLAAARGGEGGASRLDPPEPSATDRVPAGEDHARS